MMNMLCMKFRNRGRSWGPSSGSGVDTRPRRSHTISKMSPPLPITEDTPPDMLAGSMDLRVVLPSGHNVKMSVERSTPMMDLLVQVTTANKISPGDHIIQALGERGVLPYKPSTPIGALDTWTIHIVPKHQMSQSSNKKAPLKPVNQPFEQTFRLQVHLPRNQLYVARVSPKAILSDILMQVCSEKNLDPSRYSLRHPNNLEQVLNLSCTLADYKLQEVTLVYNRSLPVEVSTVDIMALQRDTTNSAYNNFTLPRNNRSCEGSVSSGSLGGRSLSPVHSDESSASPPPPPPSRPVRKRRPAPKPPTINDKQLNGGDKTQVNESETGQSATVICHSRNSSDSSGYHEASVLSESPQSNSLPDSLPRRSKLPSVSTAELSQSNREVGNNLSRSLSNLSAVGNTAQQTNMRQYNHSTSATSLSTIGGRKKKAAPPPPPVAAKMSSVNEEEQQQRTASVSSTTSSTTTLSGNDSNGSRKSATLSPSSRLSSVSSSTNLETIPAQTVPPSGFVVETVGSLETPTQAVDSVQGSLTESINEDSSELRLADEEIDRIFHNATRDHTSLESGVGEDPPLSLLSLPSPPSSLTQRDLDQSSLNPDPMDWEYKLPAPPTFRDETNSPTVTQFDTLTIGNLTEVFGPPSILETKNNLPKTVDKKEMALKEQDTVDFVKHEKLVYKENEINKTTTKDNEKLVVEINKEETEFNQIKKSEKLDDVKFIKVGNLEQKVVEKAQNVTEKKAVINELSTVITERLSKPEVDVETQMKKSTEIMSGSTLENFTITTYKDNKKPIEVFEDDSIKSSAGEKRDTSKDDAAFRAPKARVAEPSLTRTCSFSVDDKPNQPTVKRSISYVSLLAANMPRNSQPYKAHLAKSNTTLSEKVDEDNNRRHEMWPRLRKTSSEINISRDSSKEPSHVSEHRVSWQNGHGNETSGLQSLQVLRSILPQLRQSQGTMNLVGTSHESVEQERVASNSNMKFERKLLEEHERAHIPLPKYERSQSEDIDHDMKRDRIERTHSVDQETPGKSVRYVYSGPPTINLSTWNERPKRQVSIKNDTDYVFGVGKRGTEETSNGTKEKETSKQVEPANITMRLVSKNNSKVEATRPKNVDLSHVPIVRSVELKKPYAGSNMALGLLQTGKIDEKCKVEINKNNQDETFTGVNCIAKKFGQSSKQRPVSCYLFGTETKNIKHEENKEKPVSSGTSKVMLNSSGGGKKFTSIVGINGPETKVEIKTNDDKILSKIMINEEKKMKNGVVPNKIEYKSSDVRALSKLSSGGFIDPNSPVESSSVHPLSSPRNFKDSSSVNEQRSPNDSTTVVTLNTQHRSPTDNSKTFNTSPKLISSPTSAKTNAFFGSNTIDRSINIRTGSFPLPVVKGFRSVMDSNEGSGGIPPPPPIMPVLKSTNTTRRPIKQLSQPEADPRDKLLESIRAFGGKDSLKKVAK